jgi:hypothetical protein
MRDWRRESGNFYPAEIDNNFTIFQEPIRSTLSDNISDFNIKTAENTLRNLAPVINERKKRQFYVRL